MHRISTLLSALLLCAGFITTVSAQNDKIEYVDKYKYPVFTEMEAYADSVKAPLDSVTAEIRARQKENKAAEEKQEKALLLDFTNIKTPASPDVFDTVFYIPPVAQYLTGTCWAYAGISFLESEAARISGRRVKLSEMFTVYWEWIERVERFIAERGDSRVGAGSETNAVFRVFNKYGAVPVALYTGLPDPNYERHNHNLLNEELHGYLNLVKEQEIWDHDHVIAMVKAILNKHLGTPPESVAWEGQTYTPRQFVAEYLGLVPDDYVSVMSTLSVPFYTRAEFKAWDNWWHDSSYVNIPLDVWYATLKNAIRNGYSLCIGGDVSEPGVNGFVDAEAIPDYDIPGQYINQASREFRIYNGTTTDDHGIHVVGYQKVGRRDWYLTKDSSSRARFGKYEGYIFIREDFIKLKILTFSAHKDALRGVLDTLVN